MFGYVRPSLERLGEEEKERFQAAYCGLCHALGQRYGGVSRMILNYDLTFLAMLLSAGGGERCEKRCIVHPVKCRPCVCGDTAFDAAADISVILTWWQLRDGVADHGFFGGLKYRAAGLFLRRAYRKASRLRPNFDAATRRHLEELAALEKANCPSMDAVADTFARLLAEAAEAVADPVKRRVLEQLFYHLGRWIYLVDAADDLKKDVKSGAYNPLPLRYGLTDGAWTEEAKAQLAMTLDDSIRHMAAAFELADFGAYRAVVESVLYEGLYAVGRAVLDGTFRKGGRGRRQSTKGGQA